MCFQPEILLTIHMEIEGTGGADSHINLIYSWMQFSVCPDPAWLKIRLQASVLDTHKKKVKWKASTFLQCTQRQQSRVSGLSLGSWSYLFPTKTSFTKFSSSSRDLQLLQGLIHTFCILLFQDTALYASTYLMAKIIPPVQWWDLFKCTYKYIDY